MRTQSNKKDFKDQKIYVGIDVHLKSWAVTIMTESGFHKTHTQNTSAEGLAENLQVQYELESFRPPVEAQPQD